MVGGSCRVPSKPRDAVEELPVPASDLPNGANWTDPDQASLPDTVPWGDYAILLHQVGYGERKIDAEGSLYAIARRLHALPHSDWHNYRVTMSDQRRLPLTYFPRQFGALVRRSYWAKDETGERYSM
jgi:hypothetical protein